MFKCTDCAKKYSERPDYCDCGNNVFEELPGLKKGFVFCFWDVLSVLIFTICILASIGVWFVGGVLKPVSKPVKAVPQSIIPDINSFWKNPEQIQPKVTPVQPVKQPNSTVLPEKKPIVKTKIVYKEQSKKPVTANNLKAKPVETLVPAVKTVEPKVKPLNIAELVEYKTNLRKTLFMQLDIGSITGEGESVVEFNIDSNGKLTNRNFVSQSDNETVNSAVYKMMMNLPQYYPPPKSYKGEKLRMSFYFKNGYYEINYL